MRNIFDLRIVKLEYKVLYVLVAEAAAFGINTGLSAIGLPRTIGVSIGCVLSLCVYLYGARIFRGPDEPLAPPRPWWRMTAEKRLSSLFGILFVLMGIVWAGVVVLEFSEVQAAQEFGPVAAEQPALVAVTNIPLFAFFACLAFFYLNSAARLPRPQKFARTVV